MTKRRLALVLVTLVVLGAGGIWGYKTLVAPPPLPLPATAVVVRGDIEATVLANGVLKASKLVSVGAQVSGQIKSLAVRLGDEVRRGQMVAEIDSVPQRNALREAEASLENVKAQRRSKIATLKQARLAFERQKRMLAQDASPREAYENAEATLATTEADIAALAAQITQAEIAVDKARTNLGYTRIVAPMDGTVVALLVEEGQTVNAAQTTPTLIKVAQLDTMTVEAEISEADVVRVRPGLPAHFTILGDPDTRFRAELRAIEPAPASIEKETTSSSLSSSSSSSSDAAVYYNGLLDVANPDRRLRIDMTAEVSIVLARAERVLLVPSSALLKKPGGTTVTVLSADGTLQTRPVKVGIDTNIRAQVVDGLTEGDKVVLAPAELGDPSGAGRRFRGPLGF